MPLIVFVGDCHYRFYEMYDALIAWEKRTNQMIDAIIHVGDFGVDQFGNQWKHLWNTDREVPIETYVNMGNHEDYDSIVKWQVEPDRIARLHLLPDGGVTNILGLNVASVWGNYSPKSWMNSDRITIPRAMKEPGNVKKMHILRASVDKLLAHEGKVDILITHDCPAIAPPKGFAGRPCPDGLKACLGLDRDENTPPGCPGFNQLLNKFEPKRYYYGHFHVRDRKEIAGTTITALHAFDMNAAEAVDIVEFKPQQND